MSSNKASDTVLLSENRFSRTSNIILALIMSAIFIAGGLMNILKEGPMNFEKGFGIIQLSFGVIYPIFMLINLSRNSRFSPKIAIRQNKLILKRSILSSVKVLDISKVREINLAPYQINFQLDNGHYQFKYQAHEEASKSAKRLIIRTAETAGIPVNGG